MMVSPPDLVAAGVSSFWGSCVDGHGTGSAFPYPNSYMAER
jgi:hypothetical protein